MRVRHAAFWGIALLERNDEGVRVVESLRVGEGEVLLVQFAAGSSAVGLAMRWLNAEERERAGRMRAGVARDEFVVGRAVLRVLLGMMLGREPEIGVGENGKPFVEGIEFNVGHSRGLVMMAFCRGAAVGLDVEAIDPAVEAIEIAEASFAAEERAEIEAAADRVGAFYGVWTRKEAVLKAHGGGLTVGLDGFAVSSLIAAEVEVELVVGERWFVRGVEVGEGFVGALAVGAAGLAVRRVSLNEDVVVKLLA